MKLNLCDIFKVIKLCLNCILVLISWNYRNLIVVYYIFGENCIVLNYRLVFFVIVILIVVSLIYGNCICKFIYLVFVD